MAINQRLDLRQTQTLILTPQLRQAIKLLEYSSQQLNEFIDQEIEQNPLLERDDGQSETTVADAGSDENAAATGGDGPRPIDTPGLAEATMLADARESPFDADGDESWRDGDAAPSVADRGSQLGDRDADDPGQIVEQTLSEKPSLRAHLLEQINLDLTDVTDRLIAWHLLELLDDAGYVAGDLATVAVRLGCPEGRVAQVLARLQGFDPPGIFARSLAECLALQLKDKDRLDPAMKSLLAHLPLVANGERTKLMRICGVDAEDLAQMIAEIKSLDPKPAEAFEWTMPSLVTPDILMRPSADGGWIVELHSDSLPRVLINNAYVARIRSGAGDKTAREFIAERLNAANWLVRALHQRATTILKVAGEIVRRQDAFFREGVRQLRPLTRREIAEAVEMHESTVSRVTTNKYIATPRGLYELRYFFGAAVGGAAGEGGDGHAAEAVRQRIKQLIESETGAAVLSDDRLAEMLRAEGIDVARRTVAKYRESLRLPSSARRRREKALQTR